MELVYLPYVVIPCPVLSKRRKATMKRASGAHSTASKATNSWKEMSLEETRGGSEERKGGERRAKLVQLDKLTILHNNQ